MLHYHSPATAFNGVLPSNPNHPSFSNGCDSVGGDRSDSCLDYPLSITEHPASRPSYEHKILPIRCKKCGLVHQVIQRCGNRTCGKCRKSDYYRIMHGYRDNVAGIENPKLVTVTTVNTDSLDGAVERVRSCFKKLLRRRPYKNIWVGGLYSIEAVHKGRGWNVHLHVLLDGHRISHRKLSKDWLSITGDSSIVDIRSCVSPVRTLAYCVKYLIKPPACSGHEAEFNTVLKRVRLVQSFGSWHGQVTLKKKRFECPACGGLSWVADTELGDLIDFISNDYSRRGPPE
jgi:Zn finger protein HypA/HybF involved in hydrogenase expression